MAEGWDPAGYELSSRLMTIPDAKKAVTGTESGIAHAFLDLVAARQFT